MTESYAELIKKEFKDYMGFIKIMPNKISVNLTKANCTFSLYNDSYVLIYGIDIKNCDIENSCKLDKLIEHIRYFINNNME